MDDVTICNMALGLIGASTISDLSSDRSSNAEHCNTYYETARDGAFEKIDWNFARARVTLAPLEETAPEEWSYVYAYPAECVKARRISHALRRTNTPYPFEVGLNADFTQKAIFTDKADAVLVYTRRIENPNLYTPLFIEAFAAKLASLLAVPVLRKQSVADAMDKLFMSKINLASAESANEGEDDEPPESMFVEARN